MPEINLNGQIRKVKTGQTVLQVARREGIFIPTLCHHPGLGSYGACRLCLVEVQAGFRPGLAASCALPAMPGLVVATDTALVQEGRGLVVRLLLARASGSREIRALARSLGVTASEFPAKEELCILCGRCVRACAALGIHAVAFVERGAKRRVAVPFDRPSQQCLACQACVTVCPTGAIRAKVTADAVEMVEWQTRQPLQRCSSCGKRFVTERQQLHVDVALGAGENSRGNVCPACRRRQSAQDQVAVPQVRAPRLFPLRPPRKGQ